MERGPRKKQTREKKQQSKGWKEEIRVEEDLGLLCGTLLGLKNKEGKGGTDQVKREKR